MKGLNFGGGGGERVGGREAAGGVILPLSAQLALASSFTWKQGKKSNASSW